jgi:hypothetical protein
MSKDEAKDVVLSQNAEFPKRPEKGQTFFLFNSAQTFVHCGSMKCANVTHTSVS